MVRLGLEFLHLVTHVRAPDASVACGTHVVTECQDDFLDLNIKKFITKLFLNSNYRVKTRIEMKGRMKDACINQMREMSGVSILLQRLRESAPVGPALW